MLPRLLVAGQLLLLIGLLASGPLWPWHWVPALIIVSAYGWGMWARQVIKRGSQMSMLPLPAKEGKLVTTGPYRWVRHPMYGALILIGVALAWNGPTPARLILVVLLTVWMIIKALYEESQLQKMLGYEKYRRETHFLIPYLF